MSMENMGHMGYKLKFVENWIENLYDYIQFPSAPVRFQEKSGRLKLYILETTRRLDDINVNQLPFEFIWQERKWPRVWGKITRKESCMK